MCKIVFLFFYVISTCVYADWSESYGGDGVVADFTMTARSLVREMEQAPFIFSKGLTDDFRKSIQETMISSADRLMLDGVEKDAINHTLVRPYRIEISRTRWLQYDLSIEKQEKLVLHELLFTLHIDDSGYDKSESLYFDLLTSRLYRNDNSRLGPFFLKAALDCNPVKASYIVSMGVNVNFHDDDNRNALYMAALSGCDTVVESFLNMHIPSDISLKDKWSPWFAAFVGALKNESNPYLFKKYNNALRFFSYHLIDTDSNIGAIFNSTDFPPQLDMCDGQTMFMRALIGISFYVDDVKKKTLNVRNLEIVRLLARDNPSLKLMDKCGMTARDYAEKYDVDLSTLYPN